MGLLLRSRHAPGCHKKLENLTLSLSFSVQAKAPAMALTFLIMLYFGNKLNSSYNVSRSQI
jgi:hypothetical protein